MSNEISNGNGTNGNGRKKVFDVRDIQHWGIVLNIAQLIAICSAIWFIADMKNVWQNHKDTDARHWRMTLTIPEFVHWVTADSKMNKTEHPDPLESVDRFKEMKNN